MLTMKDIRDRLKDEPELLAQLEKMQEALKFCAFPYMHKPTPMEDVDARRFAAKSALIPEE
jgi:hypothetical protein